ncbi:MAG: hypothetical protein AAF797_17675 [Planctomycetota bacterium]
MAKPLTIQLIPPAAWLPPDRVLVEVDGNLEPVRYRLPVPSTGYGSGGYGETGYGQGQGIGYGEGAYGLGAYGLGTALIGIDTRTVFPAADYLVRIRAVDELGNEGPWSDGQIIPHRPLAAPPYDLGIPSNSTLTWKWSDPTGQE